MIDMAGLCLKCGEAPTINAHIIPAAAVRAIRERGPDTRTLAVRFGGAFPINTPNGLSDRKILCKSCDGAMGKSDKWFIENLDDIHLSATDAKPYELVQTSLNARFALQFAVSVIYRASLSTSPHFADISLGPYTSVAEDIATGSNDADLKSALVLINVLRSTNLDTKQFACYPVLCAGDNGVYFVYVISGIQFLVKFGGSLDGISSNDLYSANVRLDPDQPVVMCCYPFENTAEANWLMKVARRGKGLLL